MKLSSALWAPSLALAIGTVACGPPEPAQDPVTTPTTTATEPKPEPPPKCEALSEKCKAKASSTMRVVDSGYRVRPPKGWIFAQLEKAAVAQTGDEGAALVLATIPLEKNASAARKAREAKLTELAEIAKIQLPAKMAPLFQPNRSEEVAGLKWLYWQRDGAKRGKAESPVFIFVAALEGTELIGFGFAPGPPEDKEDELIMESLHSLEKSSAGAKGEGADKGAGGKPAASEDKSP